MSTLQTFKADYLTEEDVAQFLGLTVKALRNRVAKRKDHPPKISGTNLYSVESFKKWLKQREIHQYNRAS